ncbi:MAG: NUDIX domain-containing protein [Candidatus Promineifilaceae bacterium]|jgi:8-oxo-dGTP diphosphatase
MRHRVRAAALIVENDSILLVQHVHPETGDVWWVPPGGGVEAVDGDIFDTVQRETFEETGLAVELGRVVYIREYFEAETDTLHFELFLSSSGHSGRLTIRNVQGSGPDEHFIKDARWFHRKDLQDTVVYPEILKDSFWDDLAADYPQTRYLGRSDD